VSSVAIAAFAVANDKGSIWGDFDKPFDMLLAGELEMLKEKENYSMDEGVQNDEHFEMEIDNEETGGRDNCSKESGSARIRVLRLSQSHMEDMTSRTSKLCIYGTRGRGKAQSKHSDSRSTEMHHHSKRCTSRQQGF